MYTLQYEVVLCLCYHPIEIGECGLHSNAAGGATAAAHYNSLLEYYHLKQCVLLLD